MNPRGCGVWRGLPASLLLHLLAAAAILHVSAGPGARRVPPVIDLTLLPPPGSERSAAPDRAPAGESGTSVRSAASPARSDPRPRPLKRPAAETPAPAPLPVRAAPGGSAPATGPGAPSPPASSREGASAGPVRSPSPPAQDGTPFPAGVPPAGSGVPAAEYGYLRDAIQREIAYPPAARRMGWEGSVVVGFVILPDGRVRDVRVIRGSGYPVLDRSAVQAVLEASPYPRPPAEAEVRTPVVYKLDATAR